MNIDVAVYRGQCTFYNDLYDVILDNTEIRTVVTHDPVNVEDWINETEELFRSWLNSGLIVGLDVKWRPYHIEGHHHNVAIIQICIGKECLIYRIIHSPRIPRRLVEFLGNSYYRFVGVGIEHGVRKLKADYGLGVAQTEDLRPLAAQILDKETLRNSSLKELVKEVLGKDLKMAQDIDLSGWDDPLFTAHQVAYACLDAYLPSEIARCLSVRH